MLFLRLLLKLSVSELYQIKLASNDLSLSLVLCYKKRATSAKELTRKSNFIYIGIYCSLTDLRSLSLSIRDVLICDVGLYNRFII